MEQVYAIGRSTCLELAKKGERLCRQGNFHDAIPIFLKALALGSEDLITLSAIYCQLGNAYYSTNDMRNSYKYHCYDMMIAKLMKDDVGEAKACGNIGNVLKMQNLFSDAIMFTNRQFALAKKSQNKDCYARALYNLGTIYHARAKMTVKNTIDYEKPCVNSGATTDTNITAENPSNLKSIPSYYDDLNTALVYYRRSLRVSAKSADHVASGRVYGCIGNVLHLLGDYKGAVECHSERLSIACQFGDHNAQHRAYINLGNAHVLLSQINDAVGYYQSALNLAVEKCDKSREAQCSFYLANASSLIGDYSSAAMYHIRHLTLARSLNDLAGMARAYASLASVYANMSKYSKAAYFLTCAQALAKEMCDENMVTAAVESLKRLIEQNNNVLNVEGGYVRLDSSDDPEPQFHFCQITPQSTVITFTEQPCSGLNTCRTKLSLELTNEDTENSKNAFLDLLTRLQSSRLDEQRCDVSVLNSKAVVGRRQTDSSVVTSNESTEALIDLLMNAQGRRMNEQRATLLPGLKNKEQAQELIEKLGSASGESSDSRIDETLIDLLMSAHEQRMNDQRSDLIRENGNSHSGSSALTTPEEDLLAVVMRMQAGRLEEQRAHFKK